jgi:hypothetical protein
LDREWLDERFFFPSHSHCYAPPTLPHAGVVSGHIASVIRKTKSRTPYLFGYTTLDSSQIETSAAAKHSTMHSGAA